MKAIAALALTLLLTGCALIPSPQARLAAAEALAARHGWHRETWPAGGFQLSVFMPRAWSSEADLTIYIEGDGFAWLDGSRPSSDPSPRHPVALELALAQAQGDSKDQANAAYLARPCQFTVPMDARCTSADWTDRRFAPEVVDATMDAIDRLKQASGATRLILVGYSGGGTVASLVAMRRGDVARLVTIAGNLDVKGWTRLHGLRPLAGSLDPADDWSRLAHVPQWHIVGDRDETVPASLTTRLLAAHQPAPTFTHLIHVPDADHACCWAQAWPALWRRIGTAAPIDKDPA